jgi:Hypoxia induced protein conserved region
MTWGREEKYKIIGASWVASIITAFALVGRNPYLTGPQKLVQARVYAQGLTLAVLIATAAFELQESKTDGRARYESVEYIDEKDHKKHTRQVEREPPSDGDTLWKDMVKQEEERLRERDEAIKKMEERDRKNRSKRQKEPVKKAGDEKQKKKDDDENTEKEKKDDSKGEEGDERAEGAEGEEEEEEYQPVPGKKGEGKMMRKVSEPPAPGTAVP